MQSFKNAELLKLGVMIENRMAHPKSGKDHGAEFPKAQAISSSDRPARFFLQGHSAPAIRKG
jgi:hypothetical protein